MMEIQRAGNTRLSLAGSFISSSAHPTRSDVADGGGGCHQPNDLERQPSSDWRGRWLASPLVQCT